MIYKKITFYSGIRKISVFHHTVESARKFLTTIGHDAWTDKHWKDNVIIACVKYMSEDDVKDMMKCNEFIDESENEDEDEN